MSSNESFKIIIRGFDSREAGQDLMEALGHVIDKHGLLDDVFFDLMGKDPRSLRLEAETPRPVSISGAHAWRAKLEQDVTAAMKEACPAAITQFHWSSPDE